MPHAAGPVAARAAALTGAPVPEGILDALITSLIAMHDLKGSGALRNSREGSIYIVKPKMHGPEEVAFADRLFAMTEDVLGLPRNTLKPCAADVEKDPLYKRAKARARTVAC